MKYAITEGMTGRLRDLEECISDVEYRTMESTQTEQQTEKQIKKTNKQTKNTYLYFCNNIKHSSIHIIGVPK